MHSTPLISTYSIVARDPTNGDLGVATQSKFLAVGSVVPWARASTGAIATQAMANVGYGPTGLDLLAQGLGAQQTLERLLAGDPERAHRQVGVVDAEGRSATYTGDQCLSWAGGACGPNFACQGNILTNEATVGNMVDSFAHSYGQPLPERLVAALAAGQDAGGDRRGQQSAALYVVRQGGGYGGQIDRYVDLRVDDHPHPVTELQRLLGLHRLLFEKASDEDCLAMEGTLTQEVQRLLARQGVYAGPVHGQFDSATRQALEDWAGIENLEERLRADDRLDPQILEHLRRQSQ